MKAILLLMAGLPEFAPVPRLLQASHDPVAGLRSQSDTRHGSLKQDLLSDPVLNTSTGGESTALLCELV